MSTIKRDDDEVIQDQQSVRVPLTMMDAADAAFHRPGPRQLTQKVRDTTGINDARRRAYRDYENWLVNQYKDEFANPGERDADCPRRKIKRNRFGQEERTEEQFEDTGVCPTCNGSGIAPGARQTGWMYYGEKNGDEDDDDEVDRSVHRTSTHHESSPPQRFDRMTVDQLRKQHADKMSKIYADSDRKLSEQWRKR